MLTVILFGGSILITIVGFFIKWYWGVFWLFVSIVMLFIAKRMQ